MHAASAPPLGFFSWLPLELNLAHGILSTAAFGHKSPLVCVAFELPALISPPRYYSFPTHGNRIIVHRGCRLVYLTKIYGAQSRLLGNAN